MHEDLFVSCKNLEEEDKRFFTQEEEKFFYKRYDAWCKKIQEIVHNLEIELKTGKITEEEYDKITEEEIKKKDIELYEDIYFPFMNKFNRVPIPVFLDEEYKK